MITTPSDRNQENTRAPCEVQEETRQSEEELVSINDSLDNCGLSKYGVVFLTSNLLDY